MEELNKLNSKRKRICGIYSITNNINGKCYIGQSIDVYSRWRSHKKYSQWQTEKSKALYRAFRKYGVENFTFRIIEECPREQLDSREKFWISYYDSYKNGYNMNEGGQGQNRNYHRRWLHRRKNEFARRLDMFIGDTEREFPDIQSVFAEMRMVVCPDVYNLDDIEDDCIREEIDGYDTMMRELCDGYDSYEQWAECTFI